MDEQLLYQNDEKNYTCSFAIILTQTHESTLLFHSFARVSVFDLNDAVLAPYYIVQICFDTYSYQV